MNDQIEHINRGLESAILKTIEEMTFEEVEIVSDNTKEIPDQGEKFWSALPLKKPYSGELILELPLKCARKMAEQLYPNDAENINDEAIHDLIKELLNTIAGRFLNEIVQLDQGFEVGLPKSGKGTPPKLGEEVTSILCDVEGHHLVMTVVGKDFETVNH